MRIEVFLVLAAVQLAYGVIYRLNDSEYARLPPLFHLDDFEGCLRAPGDTYCYLDAKILPDDTSELSTLIQEYSAADLIHFNHTLIHWGICVTQTCRQYYGNSTLEDALEACINATLYKTHQLQARLINETTYCTEFGESEPYDAGDYVVAVVLLTLLMLNICGTIYDLGFHSLQKSFASRCLLCFSVKRNWQRLVMPSGEGPDPKLKSLQCLNGLKVLNTLLVVVAHTVLIGLIAVDNPQYQEETYHRPSFQIMYNGTQIVQTFFAISGFLLAYNILVAGEKRDIGWRTLPQSIILRWLRLTPVYAVIIAFISTWLRHLSSGPLWKPVVNIEVVDCRRDWWLHLLYVDNYIDASQCMPQAWYMSGDMQLSILGLVIFCLCRSARSRKIAIAIAFVIGLLTPATHTFYQNLHAVVIVSPETARNLFVHDETFNKLFKRGHTNIVCYAMGLALGMVMYDMHDKDFKKSKKHRLLYWGALPTGLGCVMLGMIFYMDGIQIPLLVRAVYSSAVKVCFGACVCVVIAGTLLKLDTNVRGLLEWRGWAPLGRLSYSMYMLHVCVIRTSTAHFTALQHTSFYHTILNCNSIVGVTVTLALLCWLLVESPVAQLIKLGFEGGKNRDKSDVTIEPAPQKWQEQELSSSVETVVVKTL